MGQQLAIRESYEPALIRLRLVGELDIATAPVLRERLAQLRSRALVVRLDVSRLTFIDSSGLHALPDAVHDAGRLLEFDPEVGLQVRRLLELTHTDRLVVATALPGT